jgi:hypothetical protein
LQFDAFITAFRELIASTAVEPVRSNEAACRRGLARLSESVDAVDYVTYCNLSNLNVAMDGLLLVVIKVQLRLIGNGFVLPFADSATAFLEEMHRPMLKVWKDRKKRHLH